MKQHSNMHPGLIIISRDLETVLFLENVLLIALWWWCRKLLLCTIRLSLNVVASNFIVRVHTWYFALSFALKLSVSELALQFTCMLMWEALATYSKSIHEHDLFFNFWFIVNSTQYRLYLDLPSLMVGKFHKPPSIRRDKAP